MKNQNRYTTEQTELITNLYKEKGNEGLSEIASIVDKSENSVRAKLVSEKVYISSDKKYVPKKSGPSKKEIIRNLENLGINPEGLEGATKPALSRVENFISSLVKGKK